jgi:hypothetical protein
MAPGTLARIAGATSVAFGGVGLVAPEMFAAAFGIQVDAIGIALSRLACASYIGFGALNLMARHVDDARAWQAISAGNAVSWAVSAAVVVHGLLTGLGQVTALVLLGLQVGYSVAWAMTYVRVSSVTNMAPEAAPSPRRP